MKSICLIACAVLTGCGVGSIIQSHESSLRSVAVNGPPSEHVAKVERRVRETFYHPDSLVDVSISSPVYRIMNLKGLERETTTGWLVCMRSDGKNKSGIYTGSQTTGFLFKRDSITLVVGTQFKVALSHYCPLKT